jgi:hypothetical protein
MSVSRFLRQRAVNVAMDGHYELENWYTAQGKPRRFDCRTTRVSPFRMMVEAPVLGKVGDQVASYFSDFGSLEGRISDITPREFLLELEISVATRKRMADKLEWIERRQRDDSIRDLRRQPRSVPTTPHSALTFVDGSVVNCLVIDVSLSGAAISAEIQPEIGTPLALGSVVGRVVRHFVGGFAIQFVQEQTRADLDHRIARPPASPTPTDDHEARKPFTDGLAASGAALHPARLA